MFDINIFKQASIFLTTGSTSSYNFKNRFVRTSEKWLNTTTEIWYLEMSIVKLLIVEKRVVRHLHIVVGKVVHQLNYEGLDQKNISVGFSLDIQKINELIKILENFWNLLETSKIILQESPGVRQNSQ